MINKFLKIAGVKSVDEFYSKYPNEQDFFDKHPEAQELTKHKYGGSYQYGGTQPVPSPIDLGYTTPQDSAIQAADFHKQYQTNQYYFDINRRGDAVRRVDKTNPRKAIPVNMNKLNPFEKFQILQQPTTIDQRVKGKGTANSQQIISGQPGQPVRAEGGNHVAFPSPNTDYSLEAKNNFLSYLKETSTKALQKEMLPHASFHMMPDGSIMSDAEMKMGGGKRQFGGGMDFGMDFETPYEQDFSPEFGFDEFVDYENVPDFTEDVEMLKKGGSNWIQKAVNPAHKGYCTPMTKPTCTPRRKAFAQTMKKHHGFHKQSGGGMNAGPGMDWGYDPSMGNAANYYSAYQDMKEQNDLPTAINNLIAPVGKYGGYLKKAQTGIQQYDEFGMPISQAGPLRTDQDITPESTYIYTQDDQNKRATDTHAITQTAITQPLNKEAQAAAIAKAKQPVGYPSPNSPAGHIAGPGNFQVNGEAAANWGIAGMEALTAWNNQRDIRRREKELQNMTHADMVFGSIAGDRGDYDINSGMFRPDQYTPVQFQGQPGFARHGGQPCYNCGGSKQDGGEVYMSEDEIQQFLDNGGELEFLD